MSELPSVWVGNQQCGQSFQLRTCPICRCEAQHLIGLRFSCIYLFIYVHYDENSEVMVSTVQRVRVVRLDSISRLGLCNLVF